MDCEHEIITMCSLICQYSHSCTLQHMVNFTLVMHIPSAALPQCEIYIKIFTITLNFSANMRANKILNKVYNVLLICFNFQTIG
jgi:hypothetical protein